MPCSGAGSGVGGRIEKRIRYIYKNVHNNK